MTQFKYIGRHIKPTEATKEYIEEKILKHKNLFRDDTNQIVVVITHNNTKESHYNHDNEFKVEISLNMPHAFLKVEERGASIESIVDNLEVLLKRKLKRYREQGKRWEKETPWKYSELEGQETEIDFEAEVDNYVNYEPIVKIKQYENNQPMHVAEAIERMELLGHDCFLFKDIDRDNYSMLYRRRRGGYGLVIPREES